MSGAGSSATNQSDSGLTKNILRHRLVQSLLIVVAIILFISVVYAPVFHHQFVNWDDNDYVQKNPHVHAGLTTQSIHWALTTISAANWHPVTWLSHMLDCQFFGLDPGMHHLTAVVIHAINALLLLRLLMMMTGRIWPSVLVALLFAVHPTRVESVAWVAERKDILCTMLGLLTVLCYVHHARCGQRLQMARAFFWYIAALCCFTLGLMAKPMLVTMPCALLLLDLWPLRRWRWDFIVQENEPTKFSLPLKRILLEKIPFVTLAILSSLITYHAQAVGGTVKPLYSVPFVRRVLESILAYAAYLWMLLSPTELSYYYPRPQSIDILKLLLAVVVLAVITLFAWFSRKKMPYGLIGWFWFLGTLVPVIGLLRVGDQFYADRYTYIPYIGLFVWIVWVLGDWARHRPRLLPVIVVAVFAWLMALSLLSRQQVMVWRDDASLFGNAIALDPENGRAYGCLAESYQLKGDNKQAREYYVKAVEHDPYFVPAHVNYAVVLAQYNRLDLAREQLKIALDLAPASPAAHTNMGIILAQQGDWSAAGKHLQKAVDLDPTYAPAQANLRVYQEKIKSRSPQ